jgi:hypothetical protein
VFDRSVRGRRNTDSPAEMHGAGGMEVDKKSKLRRLVRTWGNWRGYDLLRKDLLVVASSGRSSLRSEHSSTCWRPSIDVRGRLLVLHTLLVGRFSYSRV